MYIIPVFLVQLAFKLSAETY